MTDVNANIRIPYRAVVIGGGTGNSTVLTGMKHVVGGGLTAIVNTFDDGGGTGSLRDEYSDLLAMGDLRQCLEAMSHAPEEERRLLNFRFGRGNETGKVNVHGQPLGNLLLTAASQQNGGNFSEALSLVGRMYNITGKVLPASHDNRRLEVTLPDGRIIKGEHAVEMTEIPSLKGSRIGFDKEPTDIAGEALAAIKEAHIVIIAPGDIHTSIGPILALRGMREALQDKPVILITNLMNRNIHTKDFTALDYALEYERILGSGDKHVIDRILYNTKMPDQAALDFQAKHFGSCPVLVDEGALKKAGFKAVGKDLLSSEEIKLDPNDAISGARSTIRHDPEKVTHAIMGIYYMNGFARGA